MDSAVLVQPDSGGRISGGYLYNEQMARHGAWSLVESRPEALEATLASIEGALVLLDSIWLTSESIPPFFELLGRGARVGVVLHSFPSMIAAAEAGQASPPAPTDFELAAVDRLGLAVVPGPFYAGMLAGRSVELLVFEPGLDPMWRAAPRARTGECQLVSVGAATRRKGFLDLLEALEALPPGSDWRWTVVGRVDVNDAYAAAFRGRAQANPRVRLLGQRSPTEACELVRGSDVLVMPSYDENQPLVLLEAIGASVPSIAYAAGAAARMVEHGVTGLIAPVGDRVTLGRHLRELVGDEPRRYRMAQACWARREKIPSWQAAADRARASLASLSRSTRALDLA